MTKRLWMFCLVDEYSHSIEDMHLVILPGNDDEVQAKSREFVKPGTGANESRLLIRGTCLGQVSK